MNYINICERYGPFVHVEIEDYRKMAPHKHFSEGMLLPDKLASTQHIHIIVEWGKFPDFEVVARQMTHREINPLCITALPA